MILSRLKEEVIVISIGKFGNITSSVLHSQLYSPYNVCLYGNESNKYFYTDNLQNSWICFDFKDHRIIPTSYIIKSGWHLQNGHHPRMWIV